MAKNKNKDKKKILVVDGEKDMVYAITLQLKTAGFKVIVAVDGQEGLERARKEKPDLIVLDLMLPKIDGYKVSRMLKFDERYKSIPIIMLTSRSQESDKQLGFEVGADAYITKPFNPKLLLEAIEKLLGK
jgi:DNA-binding response OmpR family regulator